MGKPFPYPINSISLAGKKISIEHDPKNADDWGQYRHDSQSIVMSDAVNDFHTFKATLRHEMTHAALGMSGLTHLLSNELEEGIVRAMENLLFPAMDDLERKLKGCK